MSVAARSAIFSISAPAMAETSQIGLGRRRHISHEAGRALEILGHAIGYLSDGFVYETGQYNARNSELEAVRLLMSVNRQIYFECPEVPSFGDRCRSLLVKYQF